VEIILAHLRSDVRRHGCRIDRNGHVHRVGCVAHDRVFRAIRCALHLPGRRRIFGSEFVPRTVPDVVAAQPEIHRDVFCSRDGVARRFHFHNVELLATKPKG